MAYKPILFNTEMVQAVQVGRKTQTRRIIRPQPEALPEHLLEAGMNIIHKGKLCKLHVPYGYAARTRGELIVKPVKPPCRPGDILWVRETWCKNKNPNSQNFGGYEYRADYEGALCQDLITWRPSIHMPKEAARIFLRVKDVRVERLQDMTEEQAEKEGCSAGYFNITCGPFGNDDDPDEWTAIEHFQQVWDSTIRPEDLDVYGWNADPWVWVIEFERCERPEGWCT